MHLVQLLLPLFDNDGQPLPRRLFSDVRAELVDRFGGLTAFTQSPAEGIWKDGDDDDPDRDRIVIFEVMCEQLDRDWWSEHRRGLEKRFKQKALVVRAQKIDLL